MAVAVFLVGRSQREAASSSFRQSLAVDAMLTSMLDQETGLRGFLQFRDDEFLEPYRAGDKGFQRSLVEAHAETDAGDREVLGLLSRAGKLAEDWRRDADRAVRLARAAPASRPSVREARERKAMMDEVRRVERRLEAVLAERRESALGSATTFSVAVLLALAALFYGTGWLLIGRRARSARGRQAAEARRRESQTAFARTLQMMDSEADTHALVKRHVERTIEGSSVVVLNRDASAARLRATTPVEPDSPLAVTLVDAEPRTCLSVRLGATQEHGDPDALLECELCGKTGTARATCTPLLVSGEVIGSVLVGHEERLRGEQLEQLGDTVTQAAPVIANMRNLAIAELRAATDPLTGLANRRALQETMKRMLAHARRSGAPLTAIALDLDHFKAINDRFGHDRGDDVLAAVSEVLTSSLRLSDFVARHGGEEFVVLLPDTGLDGALTVAENLRAGISRIAVPGVDRAISASFGVAVFPEDADTPEDLLRLADRALYLAKDRGRDRVEAAFGESPIPSL